MRTPRETGTANRPLPWAARKNSNIQKPGVEPQNHPKRGVKATIGLEQDTEREKLADKKPNREAHTRPHRPIALNLRNGKKNPVEKKSNTDPEMKIQKHWDPSEPKG